METNIKYCNLFWYRDTTINTSFSRSLTSTIQYNIIYVTLAIKHRITLSKFMVNIITGFVFWWSQTTYHVITYIASISSRWCHARKVRIYYLLNDEYQNILQFLCSSYIGENVNTYLTPWFFVIIYKRIYIGILLLTQYFIFIILALKLCYCKFNGFTTFTWHFTDAWLPGLKY